MSEEPNIYEILALIDQAKDNAYTFIHIKDALSDSDIRKLKKRGYKVSEFADIRNYQQFTKIAWD